MPRTNLVCPFVPNGVFKGGGQRRAELPFDKSGAYRGTSSQNGHSLCTTQDYPGVIVKAQSHQSPFKTSCVTSIHNSQPSTTDGLSVLADLPPMQYYASPTKDLPPDLPSSKPATRLPSSFLGHHEEGRHGAGRPHAQAMVLPSSSLPPYPGDQVTLTGSRQGHHRNTARLQAGCLQCYRYPKPERQELYPKTLKIKTVEASPQARQLLAVNLPQDIYGKQTDMKTGLQKPSTYLTNPDTEQPVGGMRQHFTKRGRHVLRALLDGCTGGHRFPGCACIPRLDRANCHHCYVMSSICWLTVIITIIILIVTKVALG